MPKKRLKCVTIRNVNSEQSTAHVNATREVQRGEINIPLVNSNAINPNPSSVNVSNSNQFGSGNISSSNSNPNNSTQAGSGNLDDQGLTDIRPIRSASNLNAVDNNGQRKTKGRTTLKELWTLPPEERIVVAANSEQQPIGLESQLLAGFLGLVARNGMKLPIHFETWHQMPPEVKNEALNFIESRFYLEIPTSFVLKSLGKKWKDHKHKLKKTFFNRDKDIGVTLQSQPRGVIRWQYEKLVAFWYSTKGEEREKVGVSSRKQQKYSHTSGSKSFARKQNEKEVELGQKLGRVELFKLTHTKKDGSYLNSDAQEIVEKAKEKLAEFEGSSDASINMHELENRIFIDVTGKERHGRVRGLGMGPTPSSYYGRSSQQYTYSQSQSTQEVQRLKDGLEYMQARVEQMQAERETERARMEEQAEADKKKYDVLNSRFESLMNFVQQRLGSVPPSQ